VRYLLLMGVMFLKNYVVYKFCLFILCFVASANAACPMDDPYKGPTEQLIKRESWNRIERKLLDMKTGRQNFPLFNSIAAEEDWGHIGYHGASQSYRIFQDILKIVVEEILEIPIRDDFYFLRVPGDDDLNLNSIKEFNDYWGKLNNHGKRAKQLLSLNFGVYSNFNVEGSCSLNLFVHDKSKNSINFINELKPFFDSLGLDKQVLSTLFNNAHKKLSGIGGVLIRITENSHVSYANNKAYNLADELCYPCKRGGHPYGSSIFSNHVERLMSPRYTSKEIDIAPQFRLLINNKVVMNPYSDFQIKRWDLYDPNVIASYETELRDSIKKLESDPAKVKAYRQKLLDLWVYTNQ
jgi:hypothetical protein